MNALAKWPRTTLLASLAIVSIASSVHAATGTWSTTAGSGDLSDPLNWSAGGPISTTFDTGSVGADDVDVLTFGTSTSTTLSQTASNYANDIIFNPGASAYTWNAGVNNLTLGHTATNGTNNNAKILNDSGVTQVFNMGTGILAINGTVEGNSPIVFNGSINPGHNQNSSSRWLDFFGTNQDIYVNVDSSIHPAGNSSAAAWQLNSGTTTRANTYFEGVGGRVFLGNLGTDYNGRMILGSNGDQAVRLTHNNALGGTGGRLYIGLLAAAGGGATTQNSTLELVNDISVTRGAVFLEPRSGAVADDPHILNVSGNNTFSMGDWNTSSSEAGNWNIQSDSGKLTIGGGNVYATAPTPAGQVTMQLRGASDGQIDAPLLHYNTGPSLNVLKSGAGTWTITRIPLAGELGSFGEVINAAPTTNQPSIFTGSMTAAQGTLEMSGAGASGALSIPTYDVRSGATLKVSGLTGGGLVLNDAVVTTVKGDGTISGSLTMGTGHTIAPGDSGIGTLDITSALTINGGGALSFDLTSTPTNLGGTNDRIAVAGDLSLAGSTNVNVNLLNGSLTAGSYRLFTYNGTLTGDATNLVDNLSDTPRQSFALNSSTPNQINLVVTGGAANLTWVGGVNGNIWVDGLAEPNSVNWTGAADNHFYNGDSVTFGSTGATSVNVSGTVNPGNMSFTNNAGQNYTFSGSGSTISAANLSLSGAGNVTIASGNFIVNGTATKNGSGTLEFANSSETLTLPSTIALNSGTLAINRTDDLTTTSGLTGSGTFRKANVNTLTAASDNSGFNGTVQVTGGTLKLGSAAALGSSTATTTISTGAALDLAGFSVSNGNVIIVGTGNGTTPGAIFNSGALATVKNVELTGDATIGTGTAGSAIFIGAGPSSAATGTFTGNGFDLTVDTAAEVDVIIPGDMGVRNINIAYTGGGTADVLYIGGPTTLGPTNTGGSVNLGNNGRLGFYGRDSAVNAISQASGAVTKPIQVTGNAGIEIYRGNMTIDSPINVTGNLNTDMYARDNGVWTLNYNGAITGPGTLSFHTNSNSSARTGVVALTSDNNTYNGATTIGGGGGLVGGTTTAANDRITVSIGNGGTTGSIGAADITIAGGTLLVNQSDAYVLPNNLSGDGGFAIGNPTGQVTLTGTNTYTGPTDVRAGQLLVKSNNLGADGTNAIGYVQMSSDPSSALVLSDNVTLTKAAIYAPMRATNAANVGPQIISASGNNEITGSFVTDSAPNATNKFYTVQSNAGSNLKISGNIIADATGEAFLTLRGAGTGEVTGQLLQPTTVFFNGNPATGNVMSVIKADAGTWTLTGANEYTGSTAVQGGTLSITNPYLADAADVFLSSGAFLNLNFVGTDTIDSLLINNASQAIGTWGGIGSGAANISPLITGPGILQVSSLASLPGDYNLDGKVDSADYVVWRKDPGTHGGAGGYDVWRQNFGNPPGAGSGNSLDNSGAAVPEPTTCALLVFTGLSLLSGRRSRGVRAAQ